MKPIGFRSGGIIKRTESIEPSESGGNDGNNALSRVPMRNYGSSGLSFLKRSAPVRGGIIDGPGTGTSDSIPATIDGIQPVRLSNGEAVLNAEAVQLLGDDFIHRVNRAGLGRAATNQRGGSMGQQSRQETGQEQVRLTGGKGHV